MERLRTFNSNGFSGYVWNFMIIDGKKVILTDEQLAKFLSDYYQYEVVISDGIADGWETPPELWESLIVRPGEYDLEWWNNRLSLEEVDHHGENQSGRQPRI